MRKNRNSVDGFVRRDVGSRLGESHRSVKPVESPNLKSIHSGSDKVSELSSTAGRSLDRSDITASIRSLEEQQTDKKKRFRFFKKSKQHNLAIKPKKRFRRLVKWIIILAFLSILGIGGYVGYKFITASNNVFSGGVLGLFKNDPLQMDDKGRTNFLIFGTAEDDEGGNHGGANLTDSIMLLSVDQNAKTAFMVSLPRDLWVTYQDTCVVGNQGKLNAVYFCASDDGKNEKAGANALMSKVYEITGLQIQYYIHLNFTAVVDAVDAVGGVQIVIESKDPRGIFDDNFDWKCNFKCNMVKYPNGLTPTLDGVHALALARARGASGNTYGLPNANFDREKNQQKILEALRQKALSVGTLSNLGAVTKLIDTMGSNLRTNIDTKYIKTMMDVASKIKPGDVISVSLVDPEDPQVTTGSAYGQSIVRPVAGLLDYTGIQAYLAKKITNDPVAREAAEIVVLNGSGTAGAAQAEETKLQSENYIVTSIQNAPKPITTKFEVYQIDKTKTATAEALAKKYGVTVITTPPPVDVSNSTAFVIIVGPNSGGATSDR